MPIYRRYSRILREVVSYCLLAAIACSATAEAAHRTQVLTASDLESRYSSQETAALASKGPLGAYGPLASLGPIGPGSASAVFKAFGNWSSVSNFLTSVGGPLSAQGPLGEGGPIGESMQAFPDVFQEDGDFAVLGNVGALGALGPLGPLGPLGAHGFAADADGRYRDLSGQLVHTVSVAYESGCSRSFELFEVLQNRVARTVLNDTSWMSIGSIDQVGREALYPVRSRTAQSVTILVVPEKEWDVFEVEAISRDGRVIARSDSNRLINWIELPVDAGEAFAVRVQLGATGHFLRHSYRLILVGTGASWDCRA